MPRLARVTQVALVVNALAHLSGSIGFVLGFGPHVAEQAFMARRAGAAGVAAVVMFLVVAVRFQRDALLMALPIAFVAMNLTDSVYELVSTRDAQHLPPLVAESIFLAIYVAYVATRPQVRSYSRRGP